MNKQELNTLLREVKTWPEATLCSDKLRISIKQHTLDYFRKMINYQ